MAFKMIHIHFVLDFKHDGHQKAYSVADGHLTEIPTDSLYFGVVSLCEITLSPILTQLNSLEVWSIVMRNALLEAKTKFTLKYM